MPTEPKASYQLKVTLSGAMEDMAHPEHIAVREWCGEWFDPDFADLEQINADLAERDDRFPEDPEHGAQTHRFA